MDRSDPVLVPAERDALTPQRPPDRFAERVMGEIALRRRRVRRRRIVAGAVTAVVAAAAAVAVVVRPSAPSHGELGVDARTDVRMGPHVVAVLEPGARVAWSGDDVTQLAGAVFYRVEPGGARRVHTEAGDVTVHGTCFDVKVRAAQERNEMKRRDAIVGAVSAVATAAVLVGVYEGKVTLSSARGSVEVGSGQAARADAAGLHGPEELREADKAFEASSSEEPWRIANANLAAQVARTQRQLEDNQAERKAIEKDLETLRARLATLDPDAAAPRDPFPRTQDDWKELAKTGTVRAKNFCFPGADWHPEPGQLAELGLAPGDAQALERDLAAASQRMWQSIGPACAKIVGSADVAQRLGSETCGTILQSSASPSEFYAAEQLAADIRAGNKPMPPPGKVDGLTGRFLAMTGAAADFERDLTQDFGPDTAHRLAFGDTPWACALMFEGPKEGIASPQLGSGSVPGRDTPQ